MLQARRGGLALEVAHVPPARFDHDALAVAAVWLLAISYYVFMPATYVSKWTLIVPVSNSGAAVPPTTIHVGVVTTSEDDARAIRYFEARGLRAFSIGKPGLGRRVYVGPLGTAGALEGVRQAALEAGFAYPYPIGN